MFDIFDGHNDFLTKLLEAGDPSAHWPGASDGGHLDLPRMRQGGFAGGFFAIWIPNPDDADAPSLDDLTQGETYDVPLPDPLDLSYAQHLALKEAGLLLWMERESGGALRVCRSAEDLRAARAGGQIAAIMHMEGAEPIGADLNALHVFHAMGLRSLGPVWSRPNIFGHGVPFRYPGTPDTGDGLTPLGQDLIRACDRLGILIDLSHLNEAGFNDVARLSGQPLMATHSNAHALSPVPRNLTDRQLRIIAESGGIVGLNFATAFLTENGQADPETGLDTMLRHLDHLIGLLGEDGVALGSDFDGARIPSVIGDVTGVQALCGAMRDHGFGEALVRKIASENWLAFLTRAL
ncbi:MAG: peptidase [Rhodobacterales bacterium]|nr:MAG: peptidase [Rhodobacterales bacterium]